LTPPNFSHLFSFLFAKRLCERQRAAFFFSNGKEKSSSLPLEEDEDKKKNNTWGHGAGGPQTEIALEFENLSLSLIFLFFYYSFPVLQNFKGKILVVSFLITIFLPSVSYREMSCCCGIEHLWKSSRCTVNNSKGDARRCPLLVGAWWSLFVWLYIAAQQKKRSEEEAEMTTIWKGNSNQLKLRNI
jgi:hypothetical protein